MNLTVISPTNTTTHDIQWIDIKTSQGNFVILPGHAPTILVAKPGKTITYRLSNGADVDITVKSALIDISRDAITILVHTL